MLESLLYPHSVAVIGASTHPGKVGYELVSNLVIGGFSGDLVLVNPTTPEILGQRCYPRLEDYEGTIELSVIATPVPGVEAAVRSSLDKGARAVVVITAGFEEVGSEGAALERSLEKDMLGRRRPAAGPQLPGSDQHYSPPECLFRGPNAGTRLHLRGIAIGRFVCRASGLADREESRAREDDLHRQQGRPR